MLEASSHEQVVRDVFSKCPSQLALDVRLRVRLARGPGPSDHSQWTLWVRQTGGCDIEIGGGVTETEMWRSAYLLVCTATAVRWHRITTSPATIVVDEGEVLRTDIPAGI